MIKNHARDVKVNIINANVFETYGKLTDNDIKKFNENGYICAKGTPEKYGTINDKPGELYGYGYWIKEKLIFDNCQSAANSKSSSKCNSIA